MNNTNNTDPVKSMHRHVCACLNEQIAVRQRAYELAMTLTVALELNNENASERCKELAEEILACLGGNPTDEC